MNSDILQTLRKQSLLNNILVEGITIIIYNGVITGLYKINALFVIQFLLNKRKFGWDWEPKYVFDQWKDMGRLI